MADKNILILAHTDRPEVSAKVESLLDWISDRVNILAVLPANQPIKNGLEKVDVCLVFGGDGTILAAARQLANLDVPLVGVNMGKLGFLAEFTVEHLQKHFDDIISGKIESEERMMLHVTVCAANNSETFSSPAANEIVISAGPPFRMIDLNVKVDQHNLACYTGDGLIVATPTGSTGYNLSVGGPILAPNIEAITISPIASHSLAVRPILISPKRTIRITATRANEGTAIIIDGQIDKPLNVGDVIEIKRLPTPLKIIPHPGRGFFKTLTTKLKWGTSPHHSE